MKPLDIFLAIFAAIPFWGSLVGHALRDDEQPRRIRRVPVAGLPAGKPEPKHRRSAA